ncbi:hypothetical protein ACQPYK_50280 (plasmid) [Streptosporangium sp. CA-135522]|uniref:hypothetical protein n=1 Tax=Streptosporangium sp. CA-135522 TaxID=3240072 RepID=UPI003D89C3C3
MFKIPGVYWRDQVTTIWSGSANAASQSVTTLAGSTEPIIEALIRITGPAVNPAITDLASGDTVTRQSGLIAGQQLLLGCGQMKARLVTTTSTPPPPPGSCPTSLMAWWTSRGGPGPWARS